MSNQPPSKRTQDYLEQICEQGCATVHQEIELLEHSQPSALLKGMSQTQQQEILKELKSIMAVYDNKGCSED